MHYKPYYKIFAFCVSGLLISGCVTPPVNSPTAAPPQPTSLPSDARNNAGSFSYTGSASDPNSVSTRFANAQLATARAKSAEDPFTYVVKKGDTLWGISAHFLKDPWLWPEIWYQNGQIFNPHLIFPGDVISLSWIDGKPVLRINSNEIRLSPRIRTESLDKTVPRIPAEAIRDFVSGPLFIDPAALKEAPYVLAPEDGRLLGLEHLDIFARRLTPADGEYFLILRATQAYTDPVTNAILGYEAVHIGDARVTTYGDPSTLRMLDSLRELRAGDRMIPQPREEFIDDILPRTPAMRIEGQVIATFDQISVAGQYQIITVNLGSDHGIEVGHVVGLERAGLIVKDPITGERLHTPDRRSATGLVFRVRPLVSHVLIMSGTREVRRLDYVRNP